MCIYAAVCKIMWFGGVDTHKKNSLLLIIFFLHNKRRKNGCNHRREQCHYFVRTKKQYEWYETNTIVYRNGFWFPCFIENYWYMYGI